MLSILVSNTYGLGIAPAKTTFDFEEGSVKEGAFRIVSDNFPSKVVFTKEGDLGKYITLDQDTIMLKEPETWVNFKLYIPSDLPPGEITGGILVLEIPKDTVNEDIIMAAPAVMHKVKVNVPYPGKYLVSKMFITNTKLNEPIIFTLPVVNYGKEKINNAKATIVIKGPTNEEVAALHTSSVTIDPGQEEKLLVTWQTDKAGSYFAEAAVEYDGKVIQVADKFSIGNLEIEIERIEVNNFRLGQIAKLDLYLRNRWNTPLKVDGRIEIFKDNNIISTFNTVPVDILQGSSSVMNGYWNTEGITPGEYQISVKANYEGKTSERSFSTYVSAAEIKFKDLAAGNVIAGKSNSNTTLLVIIVFILIIFNVALFFYINKRLKNKPQ